MKRILSLSFVVILFLLISGCSSTTDNTYVTKTGSEDGYEYEYVTNDPMKTRIYTLDNGLKVYLSNYTDEPRIQVFIPVKAGSKFDPSDNTGLAHYLEHMMFKGTSKFGTIDWEKESVYIDSIEHMFNHYATLTEQDERTAYYALIDKVSNQASQYAIPNEVDKMFAVIGGEGVNAYTAEDRTVYQVNIPSNEIERYLKIESERFNEIVNRLFHTELETVYEEKNRSLDNDIYKAYEALLASMFQNHPYGTQTGIGTIEHLKNPSITEIKKYFYKYYVPNNMAICMSGDLDYSQTIKLIDKYLGIWEPGTVEPVTFDPEPPIQGPVVKDVYGPDAELLFMGFRSKGRSSRDYMLMQLIDMILNNAEAGLIDINLIQKQQVLMAGCSPLEMKDYSIHMFQGRPKNEQSLEEVKDLILEQIELVKKGDFEDWLLDAVITDFKMSEMRQLESNVARSDHMVTAFSNEIPWEQYVGELNEMELITKEELVEFANRTYLADSYAVVYKRNGEDPNKIRIEKPQITKVNVNRDSQSDFYKTVINMEAPKLSPVYVDFEKDINKSRMEKDIEVLSKVNKENELFNLNYLLDMGSNNDPKLGIAIRYLEFLGTKELSAEDFKKELYKLGCTFSVNTSSERTYVSLAGLDENMEEAVELFEQLLKDPEPDEDALDMLIGRMLKSRSDNMKNKQNILWGGLYNYGKYGKESSFTNVLSNEELKNLQPDELVDIIKNITTLEHRILYYGPRSSSDLIMALNKRRLLPEQLKPLPELRIFAEKEYDSPIVYWTDYDMVQTEFIMLSKSINYDPAIVPEARIFNEYFGASMNSVVFQEIRESQGLAYSAYAGYSFGNKKNKSNYLFSYVGTQADKQPEAMSSMLDLLNNMPESEIAFKIAKDAILSQIESERITKSSVLWSYENARDLGLDYDLRKVVYEKIMGMDFKDLKSFQENYIKGKPFITVLVGSRDKINFDDLKKYGEVQELSLGEIFGYDEIVELNVDM
jgi:predicted Zn-dependent peptidase